METDAQNRHATPEQSRFGSLHVRTFEAELLISGAVVFGLLQAPQIVNRFFDAALDRLEGHLRVLAAYGLTYCILVIYGLIGAFLIHLALRAFWIGLVGLESVFPGGIRWDRVKAGPFFIRLARRKMMPLARAIENLDDLCSLIFSFGFLIIIVFLYSLAVVALSAAGGFAASRIFFGGRYSTELFWVLFGGILGLQIVASAVDRVVGPRVRENGVVGRTIGASVSIWYAMSPMRWIGPIQLTLQSNTSSARVTTAIVGVMIVLSAGMLGIMFAQSGQLHFNSLVYFPQSLREQGLDPRHYRDVREVAAIEPGFPSIQTDVVADPYLELFIPYWPRRDNPLIRETCPDVEPFRYAGFSFGRRDPAGDDATRAAANCIASLFVVELDGTTVDPSVFEFGIDRAAGREGILAHISLSDLAAGRHELVVLAPPRRSDLDHDGRPANVRHVIPFWR
jgi:hypothetical protein